jgi:thioredoxin-related protein
MKILILLFTIFNFLFIQNVYAQNNPKFQKIKWISLKKAVFLNNKYKKPFFLEFYAPYCDYCIQMDKKVFHKKKVKKIINNYFYPVKINIEGNKTVKFFNGKIYSKKLLSVKLNVMGTPTAIFYSSGFKKIFTLPGYWNEDDFILVARWIGKKKYKVESLRKYYKRGK